MNRGAMGLCLACAFALLPPGAGAQALDRVVKEQMGADEEARASQARIDQLDDQTQRMLGEYRRALADTESYELYAKQLSAQIASQNEELAEIDRQLGEVDTTSREVLPLMLRMLDTLAQFVALDLPFLPEERANRVALLQQMMTRADVAISEKYRRILEAYQVELDYGRTLEAYEGKLGSGRRRSHGAVPARGPGDAPLPDARRRGDRLLGRGRPRRGSSTTATGTASRTASRSRRSSGRRRC